MTTTETPARSFGDMGSAVDDLDTMEQYELASRILDATAERCCRYHSPSQIARFAGVRASYDEVAAVLPALVEDGHLAVDGNGAWKKYCFVWG